CAPGTSSMRCSRLFVHSLPACELYGVDNDLQSIPPPPAPAQAAHPLDLAATPCCPIIAGFQDGTVASAPDPRV
ncbi:MAG: hypothetical protein ACOYK7_13135, partial [Pirellulales bacterium]